MRRLLTIAVVAAAACRVGDPERVVDGVPPAKIAQTGVPCLDYRHTVELHGTLRREVHPGPPNYESTADGDEEEAGLYLHLREAICARAARPELEVASEPPQNSVVRIQLVLDSADYARLQPELGREIRVRGTILAAQTGHHHAPLLLDVQ